MMRNMFAPKAPVVPVTSHSEPMQSSGVQTSTAEASKDQASSRVSESLSELVCYLSDDPEENGSDSGSDADNEEDEESPHASGSNQRLEVSISKRPTKRRKLDIPARKQKRLKREAHIKELTLALTSIQKTIKSTKTKFVGGPNGLQAH